MHGPASLVIAKAGVAIASLIAVITPELPLDEWTKVGVAGVAMFLVWWLIAKTIPGISAKHAEDWKQVGDKLDGVKEAITQGNKEQTELLRAALIEARKSNGP